MKIGLLSDVHANQEALDAVLNHLQGLHVDVYAFLGDAVGYGADPGYVCETLQKVCNYAVVGNHDAACVGRLNDAEYYDTARFVLQWTRQQLKPLHMEWLSHLPYTQSEQGVLFCHGMPLDPPAFEYLFGPDDAMVLVEQYPVLSAVTFVGHSHLTLAYKMDPYRVYEQQGADVVKCDPSFKYVITVGSVGQPRDRNPEAACGVFDTDTRTYQCYRVPYDIQRTRKKIEDAGLPSFFGDRLLLGV
jgi:diadenosine tetraphosphatase ApaH/serine/threonine PP2A family protein phosphatase